MDGALETWQSIQRLHSICRHDPLLLRHCRDYLLLRPFLFFCALFPSSTSSALSSYCHVSIPASDPWWPFDLRTNSSSSSSST